MHQVTIMSYNTLINKKNQKVLDSWMIWDSLLFVDQNRNGAKYLKHYFKVKHLTISAHLSQSARQIPLQSIIKENITGVVVACQNNILLLWCAILNSTPWYYGVKLNIAKKIAGLEKWWHWIVKKCSMSANL